MKVLPCGDRAILLDCGDLDTAMRWHRSLAAEAEAVLGARTVLLRGDPGELRRLVDRTRPAEAPTGRSGDEVVLGVTYDGDDLAEVGKLTGLSPRDVVRAHTQTAWTVAFAGFAPGFAYLVGGDPRLVVPRRGTPRASVPAGSVALAGEYSGVYPRSSPGGWQLIGRTDATLWDVDRDPPALLLPGTTVRFEEVDG